jgi:hypothetical protein
LAFPIDFTTPNLYSYTGGGYSTSVSKAIFAKQLGAKRVVDIRTDNPAGLASVQIQYKIYSQYGLDHVDVPVPEPGTAPGYVAAIQAANPKPGDIIVLSITSIGAATTYDALQTLHLTNLPVTASEGIALPPLPGHLKSLGLKDTVFPNGWYLPDNGYTAFMPVANSNGADVYVAMMNKYAPNSPSFYGQAPNAFRETLEMAKFLNEAGGPAATSDQLSQEIKTFAGPAVMAAGPIKCGANPQFPNQCQFVVGYEQRLNGKWISIDDGLNGKAINTLPGS